MLGIGGNIPFLKKDSNYLAGLRDLVKNLKEFKSELFIAADGEGGNIFNLLKNFCNLKSARYYGEKYEQEKSVKEFKEDITFPLSRIPYNLV